MGRQGRCQPRQLLDIKRQLQHWRAAVAHARAQEELDATRVILWGSSFSGGPPPG